MQQKAFSFWGLRPNPDQGLCPWTPLGAQPSYRTYYSKCKQISTPPKLYQKIPDIYFLCSCSLPNFISILSPITTQFVVEVFVLYAFCIFHCTALLCYLVLRPQSWTRHRASTSMYSLTFRVRVATPACREKVPFSLLPRSMVEMERPRCT